MRWFFLVRIVKISLPLFTAEWVSAQKTSWLCNQNFCKELLVVRCLSSSNEAIIGWFSTSFCRQIDCFSNSRRQLCIAISGGKINSFSSVQQTWNSILHCFRTRKWTNWSKNSFPRSSYTAHRIVLYTIALKYRQFLRALCQTVRLLAPGHNTIL